MIEPKIKLVGHCTDKIAKIFVAHLWRGKGSKIARIAYRAANGNLKSQDIALTKATPYGIGVFNLKNLPPSSTITYTISIAAHKNSLPPPEQLFQNGEKASFRLFPTHRPLRIALVSCNGVFTIEDEKRRYSLWKKLKNKIDLGEVDLIIHLGDQIYADPIWQAYDSNFENRGLVVTKSHRVEKITRQYRQWYVNCAWNAPDVAAVLTTCPSIMMWDDHDIYDGWGSNDDDDHPPQQAFFQAAKQAFNEFQVTHGPSSIDPHSFAYAFKHQEIGFLLLDARSHRSYKKGRVLGHDQFQALDAWLKKVSPKKNRSKRLERLFIVVGIPFVHVRSVGLIRLLELTPWTEELTDDLRDSWMSPNNYNERKRFLLRIFKFMTQESPGTQITLLSGDVHVATLGQIESDLSAHRLQNRIKPRIYQVVSSGIGHKSPRGLQAWLLKQATGELNLVDQDIRGRLLQLNGVPGNDQMITQRNFAILDMSDKKDGTGRNYDRHGNLWVEFYTEENDAPLEQCLLGT